MFEGSQMVVRTRSSLSEIDCKAKAYKCVPDELNAATQSKCTDLTEREELFMLPWILPSITPDVNTYSLA